MAHGEFVAPEVRGGHAHPGQTHVFAEASGGFHIELVKRDDAVELM